jgi:arylsulfatase A-like enzyme
MSAHDFVLPEGETTLAEVLAPAGYWNGGYSANPGLSIQRGFAQGFSRWRSPAKEKRKQRAETLLPLITKRAYSTCGVAPRPPCFFHIQYMEPHSPYAPPGASDVSEVQRVSAKEAIHKLEQRSWSAMTDGEVALLSGLYDGEVSAADQAIHVLFDTLAEKGVLEGSIVVITADHGEEFGEHGELVHGTTLFQPAIRIPLIVVATQMAAGNVVFENVSLIDIAPTLLDLVGAGPAASFEGRSLQTLMRREDSSERQVSTGSAAVTGDVLSELELFQPKFDVRVHARTLISGTRKVLVSKKGSAVMFDLARDPDELAPGAIDSSPSTADSALLQQLEQRRSALAQRRILAPGTQQLDDATKEKMRALGYGP